MRAAVRHGPLQGICAVGDGGAVLAPVRGAGWDRPGRGGAAGGAARVHGYPGTRQVVADVGGLERLGGHDCGGRAGGEVIHARHAVGAAERRGARQSTRKPGGAIRTDKTAEVLKLRGEHSSMGCS